MGNITNIELGVLVLASFLASMISTSVGFGFGITLVSFLQFFVPPVQIVGLGILMSFFNYLFRAVETRHVCTDGTAPRVTLAGILSVPLGVALLSFADPLFLRRYFSAAVLVATGLFLANWRGRYAMPPVGRSARMTQVFSGGLGGFMAGSANLGGFTVVFCSLIQHWEKKLAHVVFSRYFLATTTVTGLGMFFCGLYDKTTVLTGLGLVPVVWVGFALGARLRDRIPQHHFRNSLMVFLAVLAVVGFLNTFWPR